MPFGTTEGFSPAEDARCDRCGARRLADGRCSRPVSRCPAGFDPGIKATTEMAMVSGTLPREAFRSRPPPRFLPDGDEPADAFDRPTAKVFAALPARDGDSVERTPSGPSPTAAMVVVGDRPGHAERGAATEADLAGDAEAPRRADRSRVSGQRLARGARENRIVRAEPRAAKRAAPRDASGAPAQSPRPDDEPAPSSLPTVEARSEPPPPPPMRTPWPGLALVGAALVLAILIALALVLDV
ncbi:MAG: hypothetical protein AB7S26_37790 [Sandaracinaceae bacterium]